MTKSNETHPSTVYGPVYSWRVGQSLGIDLILKTSVCSFNCVYCQLGTIQVVTDERHKFVSTDRVLHDFKESDWQKADIITYSGSGEPTLATNLGEVAHEIKKITKIPQLVLTNGMHLDIPEVIEDLQIMDEVFVKVDAADQKSFERINRPVEGTSFQELIAKIKKFRQQYKGYFGLQMMFMPGFRSDIEAQCALVNEIDPDEVQLNTPKRPYAKEWHINSRGGHTEELRVYSSIALRTISMEEAQKIEEFFRKKTNAKILSAYKPHGQ